LKHAVLASETIAVFIHENILILEKFLIALDALALYIPVRLVNVHFLLAAFGQFH
jgi:hypothetical protein